MLLTQKQMAALWCAQTMLAAQLGISRGVGEAGGLVRAELGVAGREALLRPAPCYLALQTEMRTGFLL